MTRSGWNPIDVLSTVPVPTDVGSVHLGAVYVADSCGLPVSIRETEKLSGRFATPEEVAEVVDRMETWSALVLEHLEGIPVG